MALNEHPSVFAGNIMHSRQPLWKGVQEACDDACSICLEDFCKSDPATPSAPPSAAGGGSEPAAIALGSPSTPLTLDGNEQSSRQQIPYVQIRSSFLTSASTVATTNLQGIHSNDR
ncbi:hypothetical protein JHK85_033802 [Glycine max]|nr:hypothetical protein JHK85_033802 [Glycine max]